MAVCVFYDLFSGLTTGLRRNHGSQHRLTTEVLAKGCGLCTVHMCILRIFIPFFHYSGFSSIPRGAIPLFCSQYSRELFHQIVRCAFTYSYLIKHKALLCGNLTPCWMKGTNLIKVGNSLSHKLVGHCVPCHVYWKLEQTGCSNHGVCIPFCRQAEGKCSSS